MGDHRPEELEQTEPESGNQPPVERHDANDATTEEPVVLSGQQDAIRSVYVARTAASANETAARIESMEAAGDQRLLRGAYLTHLSEAKAGEIGGRDPGHGNTLRSAYVAHIAAAGAPVKAPRKPAKRAAAAPRKKTRRKAKAAPPAKRRAKAASAAAPRKKAKRRIAGRSGRGRKGPRR